MNFGCKDQDVGSQHTDYVFIRYCDKDSCVLAEAQCDEVGTCILGVDAAIESGLRVNPSSHGTKGIPQVDDCVQPVSMTRRFYSSAIVLATGYPNSPSQSLAPQPCHS
jgi:hypothetical protein